MKKTLIITMSFVLFILFIANSFKIDVNALSETSNYNTLGLGRTVNIAKDSYLENDKLNNAANIFDLDWFNSRLNSNELIGNPSQYSFSEIITAESVDELYLNLGWSSKFNVSINGVKYDPFKISLKKDLSTSITGEISKYKYQFYYNYQGFYPRYYANLSNLNDKSIFVNNLSQTYEGYLNLLFRGAITPQIFFDKFGTHVIVSGVYGGKIDFNYIAFNNQKQINGNLKQSAKDGLTAKVNSSLGGEITSQFNFSTAVGYKKMQYYEKNQLKALGGSAIGVSSIEYIDTQLSNWLRSLDSNNSTLIDIPEGGVIPLWDLLPDHYLYKKQDFIKKCKQYLDNNKIDYSDYAYNVNLEDQYSDNRFYNIESDEKNILNDDEFENEFDYIDLDFVSSYGFDLFKNNGYNKVRLEIIMEIKELHDGYQRVFLYKDLANDVNNKIACKEIDLNDNKVYDEYCQWTFVFEDIDINLFVDGKICIRYGSRGFSKNDWLCKNLQIKITYIK